MDVTASGNYLEVHFVDLKVRLHFIFEQNSNFRNILILTGDCAKMVPSSLLFYTQLSSLLAFCISIVVITKTFIRH